MEVSILDSTLKYAASALFALALNQSQLHQCRLTSTLPSPDDEPIGAGMSAAATSSDSDRPYLWIHEDSGLLLPVFKFVKVDDKAWDGLKETAGTSSQISHHVVLESTVPLNSDEEAMRAELAEPREGMTAQQKVAAKELALSKLVDTMVSSMEARDATIVNYGEKLEDELLCSERYSNSAESLCEEATERVNLHKSVKEQPKDTCKSHTYEKHIESAESLSCPRKVTVLYELLSACLLGTNEENKKASQSVKGYDSRYRVALRLLATWLDVKWIKVVSLPVIVMYLMRLLRNSHVNP
uniref:Uncharacterized protein n=1 Tax=Chenopodium quinoa TaxID=63459 RepID=A0A803LKD5_CHEQI